ncbi:3-ketoacyl-ACP reductase [Amycolatopsis sp. A1MSW2902]
MVTGGSRGIGRAIVRRIAAAGAEVVLTYRADEVAAKQVVAEVAAHGGRAHAVQCDFGVRGAEAGLFAAVDEHLAATGAAGVDILVNNAGIAMSKPLAEVTEDDYDTVMTVNAKAVFFTLQQALTRLNDNARVVSISSISTSWATGGEAVYAASKSAVEQFSRAASRELGKRGIAVNTVAPGVTDTDMVRGSISDDMLQDAAYMTSMGRLGLPDDIAGAVLLLVSPLAGWLTGQHLRADGGLM